MDINRAIEIINMPPGMSSPEEGREAYRIFFKELFNVNVQNENGEYKSIYNIFKEASEIWKKRKRDNYDLDELVNKL